MISNKDKRQPEPHRSTRGPGRNEKENTGAAKATDRAGRIRQPETAYRRIPLSERTSGSTAGNIRTERRPRIRKALAGFAPVSGSVCGAGTIRRLVSYLSKKKNQIAGGAREESEVPAQHKKSGTANGTAYRNNSAGTKRRINAETQ